MNEVSGCGYQIVALPKESDLIPNARITYFCYTQSGIDDIGKLQRSVVLTKSFDDESNNVSCLVVQDTLSHQVLIYDCVEVRVVVDVVHMMIDVVVHPTCRDLKKMFVIVTALFLRRHDTHANLMT
jgi:hypothetical protein